MSSSTRFLVRSGGKYGYCDPSGQLAIPARYDVAGNFHEDHAVVAAPRR